MKESITKWAHIQCCGPTEWLKHIRIKPITQLLNERLHHQMGPYPMLWAYGVTDAYTDQAHSTFELQHNSSFLISLQKWDGNVIDAMWSSGAFLLGILCNLSYFVRSWNFYLRGFSFGNWCATSAKSSADDQTRFVMYSYIPFILCL